MDRFKLNAGLYLVACKDDDRIYAEVLPFDPEMAAELTDKAEYIIEASKPPARLSADPAFFLCKFCQHKDPCFDLSSLVPSCRTCRHSDPVVNGWACTNSELYTDVKPLSIDEQIEGCPSFQLI
jgi:hypothetical protein